MFIMSPNLDFFKIIYHETDIYSSPIYLGFDLDLGLSVGSFGYELQKAITGILAELLIILASM